MFLYFFRRNSEFTQQTEATPAVPQIQGVNGNTTETQTIDGNNRAHVSFDGMGSSNIKRWTSKLRIYQKNDRCPQRLLPI